MKMNAGQKMVFNTGHRLGMVAADLDDLGGWVNDGMAELPLGRTARGAGSAFVAVCRGTARTLYWVVAFCGTDRADYPLEA